MAPTAQTHTTFPYGKSTNNGALLAARMGKEREREQVGAMAQLTDEQKNEINEAVSA
jgi:hypothetical protein